MKPFIRKILDAELPSIRATSARSRVLLIVPLFLLSIAVAYDTAFRASSDAWTVLAHGIEDGGLPATGSTSAGLQSFFDSVFLPLLAVCVAIRFGVIFLGPLVYERTLGKPLPARFALVMVSLNLFLLLASAAVVYGLGLIARKAGVGLDPVADLIGHVSMRVNEAIHTYVPTLVTIPYPWPLLAAEIPAGLGVYWFHRVQHEWRPMWLFTHRTHHISTHLTSVTTAPAEDPLGFVLAPIVQGLFVGVLTKLFISEPMVTESILWAMVTYTASEVFNHNEPTYSWTLRGPIRRFWFNFTGWGAYHLVHHSSAEEHRMANLGGGPFMIWDRIFGTYYTPPEKKPDMGLTGRPTLWMNPLRLGLAGYLEVASELRHNPAWRDRLQILLGPTRYTPPVRACYLTKTEPQVEGTGSGC